MSDAANTPVVDESVATSGEMFAGALCCDIESNKLKFNAGRLVGRLMLIAGCGFAGYKLGLPKFGAKAASD